MIMNEVFHVPMSLGGLSNCEEQLSDSLATPYGEVAQYVRDQEIAHADETGWRRGNRLKGWLWALGCSTAAFFMVHAKRSQDAARRLLGGFCGILTSDRWNGYNFFAGLRQLCWAHLKRDFNAISEANGRLGEEEGGEALEQPQYQHRRCPPLTLLGGRGRGFLASSLDKKRNALDDGGHHQGNNHHQAPGDKRKEKRIENHAAFTRIR
jgi:transposase